MEKINFKFVVSRETTLKTSREQVHGETVPYIIT